MTPRLIRNEQGQYRLRGLATSVELAELAASALLEQISTKEDVSSADSAARFLQLSLAQDKHECFAVLFLDNCHQVIAFERLFNGTIDGAAIYPRVVAQRALELNAAAVILAHNHPSGHNEPSQADRNITNHLKQALSLLDIRVLDHFVVSASGWVSFVQRGLL